MRARWEKQGTHHQFYCTFNQLRKELFIVNPTIFVLKKLPVFSIQPNQITQNNTFILSFFFFFLFLFRNTFWNERQSFFYFRKGPKPSYSPTLHGNKMPTKSQEQLLNMSIFGYKQEVWILFLQRLFVFFFFKFHTLSVSYFRQLPQSPFLSICYIW